MIFFGPAHPSGRRCQRGAKILIQCVEAGVRLQKCASRRDERAKLRRSFGSRTQMPVAEIAEQQFQNLELEISDAAIIDQACRAQSLQPRDELRFVHARARARTLGEFPHRRDCDIHDVEKMSARRTIGARAHRIGRCKGVQGIQADEACAARRQPPDEMLEIAEIPDPPIVSRAQRVELHRHAP